MVIKDNGTKAEFTIVENSYTPKFRVTVIADNGMARSQEVKFSRPFTITTKTITGTAGIGMNAEWKVTAKNTEGDDVLYQWQRGVKETYPDGSFGFSWEPIDGATEASYSRTVLADDYDDVKFRCVVTNKVTKGTETVLKDQYSSEVTVKRPFKVAMTPSNGIIVANMDQAVTLKVSASGAKGKVTYQWSSRKMGSNNWEAIQGATKNTYKISKTDYETYNTEYRCTVTAKKSVMLFSGVFTIVKPFTASLSINPDMAGIGWQAVEFVLETENGAARNATIDREKGVKWLASSDGGKNWTEVLGNNLYYKDNTYWMDIKENPNAAYGKVYRAKITATEKIGKKKVTYIMYSNMVEIRKPFNVSLNVNEGSSAIVGLSEYTDFEATVSPEPNGLNESELGSAEYEWYGIGPDTGGWVLISGSNDELGLNTTGNKLRVAVNESSISSIYDYRFYVEATITNGNDSYTIRSSEVVQVKRPFEVTVNSPTVSMDQEAELKATIKDVNGNVIEPEAVTEFLWCRGICDDKGNIVFDWNDAIVGTNTYVIDSTGYDDYSDKCGFCCRVTVNGKTVDSNEARIIKAFVVNASQQKDPDDPEKKKYLDPGVFRQDSGTVTFTASSTKKAKTFTWQVRTGETGKWEKAKGASNAKNMKSSSLKVTVNEEAYGRQYRCLVSDGKHSVASVIFYVEPTDAHLYTCANGAITGVVKDKELTHKAKDGAVILPAGKGGIAITAIGNGAETEGNGLFEDQISINGAVYIPSTIKSIGDYAFKGCDGITTVTLSDEVNAIGQGAFKDCSSLSTMNTYK